MQIRITAPVHGGPKMDICHAEHEAVNYACRFGSCSHDDNHWASIYCTGYPHMRSSRTDGANRSTVKLTLSASRHADATLEHSSPHTLCSIMFQARA